MVNFWFPEVLLALSALLVASQYWYISRERYQSPALLVVAGLLCLALAALAGAYRYGIDPYATDLHRALSRLSGYVSFFTIGIALLWTCLQLPLGHRSRAPAYLALVLIIALALAAAESSGLSGAAVSRLFSTLGLVLWLLVGLWQLITAQGLPRAMAALLLLGAVLIVFAGLVVGTDASRVFKVARMNWFHLLLAAGVLLLLSARPLFVERNKDNV